MSATQSRSRSMSQASLLVGVTLAVFYLGLPACAATTQCATYTVEFSESTVVFASSETARLPVPRQPVWVSRWAKEDNRPGWQSTHVEYMGIDPGSPDVLGPFFGVSVCRVPLSDGRISVLLADRPGTAALGDLVAPVYLSDLDLSAGWTWTETPLAARYPRASVDRPPQLSLAEASDPWLVNPQGTLGVIRQSDGVHLVDVANRKVVRSYVSPSCDCGIRVSVAFAALTKRALVAVGIAEPPEVTALIGVECNGSSVEEFFRGELSGMATDVRLDETGAVAAAYFDSERRIEVLSLAEGAAALPSLKGSYLRENDGWDTFHVVSDEARVSTYRLTREGTSLVNRERYEGLDMSRVVLVSHDARFALVRGQLNPDVWELHASSGEVLRAATANQLSRFGTAADGTPLLVEPVLDEAATGFRGVVHIARLGPAVDQ